MKEGETWAENHLLGWSFKGRSDGCDAIPVDFMEGRGFAIFIPAGVGGGVVTLWNRRDEIV